MPRGRHPRSQRLQIETAAGERVALVDLRVHVVEAATEDVPQRMVVSSVLGCRPGQSRIGLCDEALELLVG